MASRQQSLFDPRRKKADSRGFPLLVCQNADCQEFAQKWWDALAVCEEHYEEREKYGF